jgi:hypothetical protein
MELTVKTPDSTEPEAVKHQLAKMIIGTAAGFITTKLVETAYDSLVEKRRNKNAE